MSQGLVVRWSVDERSRGVRRHEALFEAALRYLPARKALDIKDFAVIKKGFALHKKAKKLYEK